VHIGDGVFQSVEATNSNWGGQTGMRHFSLEKWVDFARNVIREDEKAKMQSHLQTGCSECLKELNLWRRLQQTAQRETAYEPSHGAVRAVNATFANQRIGQPRSAKREVGALLFDSLRTPVLAGARSSGSIARQLLYGAHTYRIDIRIEPQTGSEKVLLVGQILNSADPSERLSRVQVALLKGRRVLSQSVTTLFGEFQMECALEEGFRLMVSLPGGREVSLPLIEPTFSQGEKIPDSSDFNKVSSRSKAKRKRTRTKG
jgi:hypothetical protein